MVKILDCTTRDGGYCSNWNYSDEYIFDLIKILNQNNITFYEIGYRNYYEKEDKGPFYNCTLDFIKKFYENKGDLQLGVMVDAKRFNEIDFKNAKKDYLDFVRIAARPDKVEQTLSIAELLNSRNYNVMLQLMDITNLEEFHYELLKNWKNKSILLTVYMADTYGIINPDELRKYFEKLKEIGYQNISFHAHNKSGYALENSLVAAEIGAFSIDVTQDGNGVNGGNLPFADIKNNMFKNFQAINI